VRVAHDQPWPDLAVRVATAALRWVTGAGVATADGLTWPETAAPGSPLTDDLYSGTAGVLAALAEARLSGIRDFDDHAAGAVGQLCGLAGRDPAPDPGLYTGLAGAASALRMWALVTGDATAADGARGVTAAIARLAAATRPVTPWRDLIAGEAGVLLVLTELGPPGVAPVAAGIADHLVAEADWADGLPEWRSHPDKTAVTPNFSHGAAGIGYALAAASVRLRRPDLLDLAALAARRLVQLGRRPDGTIAVPNRIPPSDSLEPVSYGWCHGPTGTLRLFALLDRLQPGRDWASCVQACRRAVRSSGLPARWRPGFWDNVAQCCGTAGVGEMAVDSYQDTGDEQWLRWSAGLAADVLNRQITDSSGTRWSNTEYRDDPVDLAPELGWMQGAAGIAAWLLRLARVNAAGTGATRLWWPDRPAAPEADSQFVI